ncbi:hypothetical protein PV11_03239 [Exophiala sideris]|uniref:Uncharacterized protein n=1 Tax=Exophiala sideris TaxID=1016849 RepID=A0A0D1WG17_9EURO|nr:hypothetical protein PV11_03239 [Exophiala sideris]
MESAIVNGHEHIVQHLLNRGADANCRSQVGETYLHQCLRIDNIFNVEATIQMVTALRDYGADFLARDLYGQTPLHVAVASTKSSLFRRLIQTLGQPGLDSVHACPGSSLLVAAVQRGADDAVIFLLDHTEIDAEYFQERLGWDLPDYALARQNATVFCKLFDKGFIHPNPDSQGSSLLYRAVASGHLPAVEHLIAAGMRDDSKRKDRSKAIHRASLSESANSACILECLLNTGQDPNVKMNPGTSPLHILTEGLILTQRLTYGTDWHTTTLVDNRLPDDREWRTVTLLDICKRIELLIEHPNTDLSLRNGVGQTPAELYMLSLSASVYWENKEVEERVSNITRKLMFPELDLRAIRRSGKGVLHIICPHVATKSSFSLVRTLVERGVELCEGDDQGETPFEILLSKALGALGVSQEIHHREYESGVITTEPQDKLVLKIRPASRPGLAPGVELSRDILHYLVGHTSAAGLSEPMSDGWGGHTPMTVGLKTQCHKLIELLLSKDDVSVDVRSSNMEHLTSLEVAASEGCDMEMAKRLLGRSYNDFSSLSPVQGWSILHFAASETSDQAMLRALLAHRPQMNYDIRTRDGQTPLGVAILNATFASAVLLLEAGASVNVPVTVGHVYPVHLAVEQHSLELLQSLLAHGADVDVTTESGLTALEMAASSGQSTLVDFLIQYMVESSQVPGRAVEAVKLAAEHGQTQIIDVHLGRRASANPVLPPTVMPLLLSAVRLAAEHRHWQTVEALLRHGVPLSSLHQSLGDSLLHTVVAEPNHASLRDPGERWHIVGMLLEFGADYSRRNEEGHSPFSGAVLGGNWDIVEGFLRSGLQLDANTSLVNGWTVMHFAIFHGAVNVVKLLRQYFTPGVQNIIDDQGKLAGNFLTCAVASGNHRILDLVPQPLDYTFVNDYGWTIAHFAALSDKLETLLWCQIHGINCSASTATHQITAGHVSKVSPLHLAAVEGRCQTLNFFKINNIIHDIDVRTCCEREYTALHLAVLTQRDKTVERLLELGADPFLTDKRKRRSAFHMAAGRGYALIFSRLMKHRSQSEMGLVPDERDENFVRDQMRHIQRALSIEDIYGMTPEMLAIEKGNQHVMEIVDEFDSYLLDIHTNVDRPPGPRDAILAEHNPKPTWNLKVKIGPWMRKIMASDYRIYAVKKASCPRDLKDLLMKHTGAHVEYLGPPCKRHVFPDLGLQEDGDQNTNNFSQDRSNTTRPRDPLQKKLDEKWKHREGTINSWISIRQNSYEDPSRRQELRGDKLTNWIHDNITSNEAH